MTVAWRDNSAMQEIIFELRGEFIPVDSLLKAAGVAESGGRARMMVVEGMVTVDGQPESRKTAKIRAGQTVRVPDVMIKVVA